MLQRSVTTGEYQQILLEPELQFSNKSESSIARIEESDQRLDLSGSTWNEQKASISISFPEPVYVEKVQGDEFLVYKSGLMELNKIYEVEWKGEKYGVRKTEKKVELFKFYSNNGY